jgi:hypothetical protein
MGQLKVEAINPVLVTTGAKSFLWLVRGVEWELTCGFCRTRINRIVWMGSTSVICPVCGTRNLLSSAGWLWRRLF